jgi:cytoskeletal protein RodZ
MTMKSKQNSDRMNNFFSGVAIILSLLAGIMGAFSVFKIASVEQQVEALNRAVTNQQQAQLTLSQGRTAETASSQSPDSATSETSPKPDNNVAGIQPGQFVQPALESRAAVELLTVKRIQDPETGARDVVNVQFRVRRIGKAGARSIITPTNTTARNPNTGETYDSYRTAGIKADKKPSERRATSGVLLLTVKEGASVDAYVWLKVPEGVNLIDLYIPETQVFRNIPIAS